MGDGYGDRENIEPSARRRLRAVVAGCALLVALALSLAGCGGKPPGDGGGTGQGAGASATDAGGDLLEPQAAPAKKLSFRGAGPGNGAFGDAPCAFWTWDSDTVGDVLSGGVAFVVERIGFDPDVATATRVGCSPGDKPWCESGTLLTADSTVCQFGVEPSAGAAGTVTAVLYGHVDCSRATEVRCADAVAALRAAPPSGATLELPPAAGDDGASPSDASSSADTSVSPGGETDDG